MAVMCRIMFLKIKANNALGTDSSWPMCCSWSCWSWGGSNRTWSSSLNTSNVQTRTAGKQSYLAMIITRVHFKNIQTNNGLILLTTSIVLFLSYTVGKSPHQKPQQYIVKTKLYFRTRPNGFGLRATDKPKRSKKVFRVGNVLSFHGGLLTKTKIQNIVSFIF